jgi:hypothetical protein
MRHYLISGGQVTICRKRPTKLAKSDLLVNSSEDGVDPVKPDTRRVETGL